jgi:peptidoglycan hydrolase CwlO-like protein
MSFTNFTAMIQTFGLVVLAAAFWYGQWRSGSKQISSEVVGNYERLDKQQKEQIASKDAQIAQYQKDVTEIKSAMNRMKEDFANQIGKLQGQLDSKDKQIDGLQKTILNRNPELESILKEIRDFMKKLNDSTNYQTGMLEGQLVREKRLDTQPGGLDNRTVAVDAPVATLN